MRSRFYYYRLLASGTMQVFFITLSNSFISKQVANEWMNDVMLLAISRNRFKFQSLLVTLSSSRPRSSNQSACFSVFKFITRNFHKRISGKTFADVLRHFWCEIKSTIRESSLASEIVYFDGFYVVSRRKRSFFQLEESNITFFHFFIGMLRNHELNIRASEQHAGFNGRKWSRNVQVFLFLMMSSLMWASEPERHDRESLCNQHVCLLSFS